MPNIGLFYGSTTGNTENAATLINAEFGGENIDIHNIAECSADDLAKYDTLILGTSTWGYGELQDDWACLDSANIDFTGKTVALFGLGDQESYAETFVDGMGILYKMVISGGGKIVGSVPWDGYDNSSSEALVGDVFVGLPLDEDNQPELTGERIKDWVALLKEQI